MSFDELARRAAEAAHKQTDGHPLAPSPSTRRRNPWLVVTVTATSVVAVILFGSLWLQGTDEVNPPVAGSTTTTTLTVPDVRGPSQSPVDAARDGVVPELAELPIAERVSIQVSIPAAEGIWAISEIPGETETDACIIGDRTGEYGTDFICTGEYREILLLSDDAGSILRAYPLPSQPASHLLMSPDAVYCGRQGDGGLPDSMLCRIDRDTLQMVGRLFPYGTDSAYGPEALPLPAGNWKLEDPDGLVVLETMELRNGLIVTTGHDGTAFHDPVTLERLDFDPAPVVQSSVRYRVNAAMVAADTVDPYLNVRHRPGTSNDIKAKLPPTYAGIRWTGESQQSEDGQTWYMVELLDPIAVNLLEPLHGGVPAGWVNSTYLEELPEGVRVTSEELPPCSGAGEFGSEGGNSDTHVSSLEIAEIGPGCTRVVLGFSTGQASYGFEDVPSGTRPAGSLPRWYESQGPYPMIINLPDTITVWPGATDAEGVYVVRERDGSLSLRVMHPANTTYIHSLPDKGLIVVDLRVTAQSSPAAGNNVVLNFPPMIADGAISVTGFARPFEATLGISIEDAAGDLVEAVYSGSPFRGTTRDHRYGVETNDWAETWGSFAVEARGLSPGEYTLLLSANDGSDLDAALRIPFVIETESEDPTVPSDDANRIGLSVVSSAMTSGQMDLPLADTVTIRLGNSVTVTRSAAELADRANWVVEAEHFNGYSGPFDVLGVIAARPNVRISEGPIQHCAGPPMDWWPGALLVRPQINIEPIGIDSCLQWNSISLLVNETGVIQQVILDLWEP